MNSAVGRLTSAEEILQFPLLCVSFTFRRTPIEVREELLRRMGSVELFGEWLRDHIGPAWVVVTCHRIEFYLHVPESCTDREILQLLTSKLNVQVSIEGWADVYRSWEAAKHAFLVAAGLDSMLVGERQVLQQLAEAARRQQASGMMDELLVQLARRVTRAGQRIRKRVGMWELPESVATAAVNWVLNQLQGSTNVVGVVFGTGVVAREALRALAGRVSNLAVAGRRRSRTARLAQKYGATPLEIEEGLDFLRTANFAIFGLHMSNPIKLDAARLAPGLLLVDLGVPRNVVLENCDRAKISYNCVDSTVLGVQLPKLSDIAGLAASIVAHELELLERWYIKWLTEEPVATLFRWASTVVELELERSRGWIMGLSEVQRDRLRQLLNAVTRRLLAAPVEVMRWPDQARAHELLTLFGLERDYGKAVCTWAGDRIYGRREGQNCGSPRHGT